MMPVAQVVLSQSSIFVLPAALHCPSCAVYLICNAEMWLQSHDCSQSLETFSDIAHLSTRSKVCPFTVPPPSDARTLRLKPSRFCFRSSAASLFNGSDALGSRKRNYPQSVFHSCYVGPRIEPTCNPTTTAFRFNTGFQSSRRMLRHTLPSRSMLGW